MAKYIRVIRKITEVIVTCDGVSLDDGNIIPTLIKEHPINDSEREETIEPWRLMSQVEDALLHSTTVPSVAARIII